MQTFQIKKPFIFVLMPFAKEFSNVYEFAIKGAVDEVSAYAERVDEQVFEGSILDRIYNQISTSDIVIADMTGRNPNVFYEVGYAHAIGKTTILITKTADDIPFDLKHYSHIVYEDDFKILKDQLVKKLRYHIQNPSTKDDPSSSLQLYHHGEIVKNRPHWNWKLERVGAYLPRAGLDLDLFSDPRINSSPISFKLGLVCPAEIELVGIGEKETAVKVKPTPKTVLFQFAETYSLSAGSWQHLDIWLRVERTMFTPGKALELNLRVFLAAGTIDFPFLVSFQQNSSP